MLSLCGPGSRVSLPALAPGTPPQVWAPLVLPSPGSPLPSESLPRWPFSNHSLACLVFESRGCTPRQEAWQSLGQGGADISRLLNRYLGDAKEGRQATGGPGRLVSLPPDLGPPKAEPWHQEAWLGLARGSREKQVAVESGQVVTQNLTKEVAWSSSGRGGACPRPLYPSPTPPPRRLGVQAATQLGARASLELSLRSWLRLASRSRSSVSSCVCSVCASTRRDSLCSTLK